jgi:diguanylate cyclase (GGDEF)-like protein
LLTFYIFTLSVTILISLTLASYAWRRRSAPGATPFSFLLFAVALWALGYIFELTAPTLDAKLFWVKLEYLAVLIMPVCWLALILQFSGMGDRLKAHYWGLLLVEPVLIYSLILTNPNHNLVWREINLVNAPPFPQLEFTFGPAFWLHCLYSYSILAFGVYLLLKIFMVSPRIFRRQAVFLLIGAVLPWTGNLMFIFDTGPFPNLDLTPVLFVISSPALGWSIFRLMMLDLLPVAYDTVIAGMGDGVVVLDLNNRVVDSNPSAQEILGKKGRDLRGLDIRQALANFPQLIASCENDGFCEEIGAPGPQGKQWFEAHFSTLINKYGEHAGRLLIFHNVTHHNKTRHALHRRAVELGALNETLLDIATSQDLQVLLQTIVRRAARLLDATGGALYLVEEEARQARCLVSYDTLIDLTGLVMKYGEGATGYVAETGSPLIIPDYRTWSRRIVFPEEKEPVVALVCAPMNWQGKVIGVINVIDTREIRRFSEDDLEMLALFANQAAIAVANARLFEAEQRRAREAETIRQAVAAIAATLDQNEAIERILEQLAYVVPFDSASVQLLRDNYLEIVGGCGWPNLNEVLGIRFSIPGDNPNTRVVLERRTIVMGEEIYNYRSFNPKSQSRICSWLGAPLIVHEQVVGMLAIDSIKPNFFTSDHARLITIFAGQVAVAMENARLYAETQQKAEELSRLYEAAQDMAASLETEVVLNQLARHLTQALDATSSRIFEINPETREVNVLGEYWSRTARRIEQVSGAGCSASLHRFHAGQEDYQKGLAVSYSTNLAVLDPGDRQELEARGILASLAAPIMARGRLLGEAVVWESRRRREFSEAEKRLAQALVQHGVGVLENTHLYNTMRQRAIELDALRATMADLSAELEISRLLKAIIERATSLLGAVGGDLAIYDEKSKTLKIVVSYNMDKDYTGTVLQLGEGAMGKVSQTLEPMIVQDYQTWEGRSNQYQQFPWHAAVAAPLLFGGKLVGSLGVIDQDPHRQFTQSDEHLLTLFAQQAAIAVQNARLYQSAKAAAARRAILHNVSQEIISANLDNEAVYKAIHHAATKIMPTEAFVISRLDPVSEVILAAYLVDRSGRVPPITLPAGRGFSGYVIATGKSLLIDDVTDFEEIESLQFGDPQDVSSVLAVPMRLGGRVTGMLSAQCYRVNAYSEEDRYLLEMLAAYAAIALENTRLFGELQHMAVTDPLTGLSNRRQLFELGQREFSRSRRFNRPLSAIMIDADNFKEVNDNFGHAVGDEILIVLSQRLRESIREIDILGRYGGDEFAVVLPETEEASAGCAAERLLMCINKPIPTAMGEAVIRVSVGVAAMRSETPSLEALMIRADTAMYTAKKAGGNRVQTD